MPFYMIQAAYTPEAWAALAKQPADRIEAIRPVIEGLKGKLVSGFLSFGAYDVVLLIEMPDNVAASAFAMAASAGGALKSIQTTPLLTTEEAVRAMHSAAASGYSPPELFDTDLGLGIE